MSSTGEPTTRTGVKRKPSALKHRLRRPRPATRSGATSTPCRTTCVTRLSPKADGPCSKSAAATVTSLSGSGTRQGQPLFRKNPSCYASTGHPVRRPHRWRQGSIVSWRQLITAAASHEAPAGNGSSPVPGFLMRSQTLSASLWTSSMTTMLLRTAERLLVTRRNGQCSATGAHPHLHDMRVIFIEILAG